MIALVARHFNFNFNPIKEGAMLPSSKVLLAVALVVGGGMNVMAAEPAAAEPPAAGAKIGDFTLKSQFGKEYSLADFADSEIVVVAFLGVECPLARLYGPRLARLSEQYAARKVSFLGIDPNRQDSLEELAAFARRHDIEFPLLRDTGSTIADRFGALRTPEVFVLDRDRTVRYRGRIDNQYGFESGVGYQRPAATRNDLVEALEEVLDGKTVSVASTEAPGCLIGRSLEADATSPVTYSNQIARVLQAHCVECHRAGRIGPFEMTNYEEVAGWGEMIAEVVRQERMPPWHAHPDHGQFTNDARLSDDEKQLIYRWVEAGCPEGDPSQLPPPAEFFEGWSIGEPDQVVYMSSEPFQVPAEGVVEYQGYVVDPGWTEDKWITGAEAKPGSLATVHHILVTIQAPGRSGGGLQDDGLLATYAPGANPTFMPGEGIAMHVPAGSKLKFQMHYTPTGQATTDRSYCGIKFIDAKDVKYEARSAAIADVAFTIPAGESNHESTAKVVLARDTLVDKFMPHMHTRGKAFRYEAIYPDGRQEILLDVPRYDFNWQTTYFLVKPKQLPKGTELLCTAWWDNSEENLSNPDPTIDVSWGDQTWEEMMIGFYVELFPKGTAPPQRARGDDFGPDKLFTKLDRNQDGALTRDEVPKVFADHFDEADSDADGKVTRKELAAAMRDD